MEWMLMPLRRYADFSGRSRRKEFWMFQLGLILFYVLIFVFFAALGGFSDPNAEPTAGKTAGFAAIGLVFLLVILALFIPSLAVTVRRLHDTNRSGWWFLIAIVPFGSFVLLVFYLLDGTPGTNDYGPDPKDPHNADVFA